MAACPVQGYQMRNEPAPRLTTKIPSGAIGAVILAVASPAGAADIPPQDLEFFEKEIRPVLIEHCYECHSEEAGERKGGLWLDRREGWQLGGDSGRAAVPGDVDGSRLIEAVHYGNPDLEMPPDGKLPAAVIADLEEWVRRGLPEPRDEPADREEDGLSVEEGREFWSYRPRRTDFPEGRGIDDFLDERLAEAGLEPVGPASPAERLRRARIDLTGLPPTVEEQKEFLADPSPAKWEEMIDRWLASDAFGERWGRHWLDLARYADSSGGGRAIPMPDAWRFRDYVIESFRQDRPLDQLIVEHLAGDLLPHDTLAERRRQLVATGFLVLGPINYENQNKDELELDIVDEQLDTMGRAFLGQTLGCARCHDHKFDPIPTHDYYAMAGIFLSTDFVEHANVSRWHTERVPETQEQKAAIAGYEKEKAAAEKKIESLEKRLADLGRSPAGKGGVAADSLAGVVIDDVDAHKTGEWQESTHSGRWVGAGYIHDRKEQRGEKAVRFETVLPEGGDYEVRLSYSSGDSRNPAVPVTVSAGGRSATFQLDQRPVPEHDGLFETVGVVPVEKGATATVEIRNDGEDTGYVIVDAVQWLPVEAAESGGGSEESGEAKEAERLQGELASAKRELKRLKRDAPDIPTAMSVVDRKPEDIGGTPLRIRGMVSNHGDVVPRGFLEVVSRENPDLPDDRSGRLALARWITDPDQPLTPRVLANRIWLKLMGEGIVPTPDNFGATGQPPTHPELLDYLAHRLVSEGWSTKALVREIMLSDAYSRSTHGAMGQREVDPENELYWRAHLRPLDAETLRDAMLSLSGALNRDGGGPSLPAGFKSEFGYEFTTKKRSVYVPVFRNAGHEMLSVFDFANPNFAVGRRTRSTIPTQSLFLANSDFVHESAAEAAGRLLESHAASDRARIELAFRRTVGRPPTESEIGMALQFLRESGDSAEENSEPAWAALQRGLFQSVDFRYLR